MTNYRRLEEQFSKNLGLERRPVAIKSMTTVPHGVAKFTGTVPSSCSFWRLASEGRTFYTVPSDHYNCPIGAYTHNIPLPPDREKELSGTLNFMADIGYIRMAEVPGIPRLPATPAAVVYAPLGDTPLDPDAVIFSGPAGAVMLLQESAIRAGAAAQTSTLGRPTCMAVPAAMALGTVASAGCVGNRVYTDLGPGELYAVVPAKDLERVAAETATIREANLKLLEYHTKRRQELTSGG
jgi:uncharacterized protein (DUF169 family)